MDFAHLSPLDAGKIAGSVTDSAAASGMSSTKNSRRTFLKGAVAVSGGLVLGFHVPGSGGRFGDLGGMALAQDAPKAVYPPNAFIRIAPDETVTILINKLEFGQGVMTSLPMLIAEELDCDWANVRAEHSPVAPVYNHPTFGIMITGGSMSIASSWQQFRVIGASARLMLIQAAAQQWNMDPAKLDTRKGFVVGPGGKKASFGSLAEAADKLTPPGRVGLKTPVDYDLIGKPVRRLDAPAKTNGTAQFGIDKTLPGMKYAVVARPPSFGGKAKQFLWPTRPTSGAVKAIGVDIDRGGKGVAVIADHFWDAKVGRDKLEIEWEAMTDPVSSDAMMQQYRELSQKTGMIAKKDGDLANAKPVKSLTLNYEFPYLAHAPMEPLNCVVDLKADSCDVWAGSQFQTVDSFAIARAAGLKPEQVTLTTMLAGGGFGRRAVPTSDYLVEAVNVAKAMHADGTPGPVKVIWTREDDIRGGYYRPAHAHRVVAGVDAKGRIVSWEHVVVGQSIIKGTAFESVMMKDGVDSVTVEGIVDHPYLIPNFQVSAHHPTVNVPVLWWRSVGHTHTGFVMETAIDELAAAAKQDPVKFRLANLDPKQTRHIAALKLVAEKSGWSKPLPKGHARGVALHESFGTVVAHVVEVSVADNQIKVHKVTSAVHCGTAVNPLTIEAQVQGAIVFGLSAALYGKVTLKDGRVEQSNFSDYPVLRMSDMPQVAVFVVPSNDPPTGMGEPGVPPTAPAIANAVFSLTGKRLRKLPFDLTAA